MPSFLETSNFQGYEELQRSPNVVQVERRLVRVRGILRSDTDQGRYLLQLQLRLAARRRKFVRVRKCLSRYTKDRFDPFNSSGEGRVRRVYTRIILLFKLEAEKDTSVRISNWSGRNGESRSRGLLRDHSRILRCQGKSRERAT